MATLSTDPKVVNAAIAEALKEEPVKVITEAPANNDVILPGGYISPGGVLAKYAEVKELNGSDEEAISRIIDKITGQIDMYWRRANN